MPGTKKTPVKEAEKKDLYLAISMGELNKHADLPAKLKTTNAKLLVKTADKILKEAEHSEILHDEERAYVLFMKYFNVVSFLKKTADYKKQKAYYNDLLGQKNLLTAIDKAEELSADLKERYDQMEAKAVAEKLSSLDSSPEEKIDVVEDDVKKKKQDRSEVKEETPPEVKEEKKGSITCESLFHLLEDKDTQIIVMDVRPGSEFNESCISDRNCISVPAEAVPPGTTVTHIEKKLPGDSISLWKQRGNVDHIILMDWNGSVEQLKIGTPVQTLKDALFKYDSTVIIKSEPLVLEGGYKMWMLHYPTLCINPDLQRLSQPPSSTSNDSLMDFDYPDFDQAFLMTPTPTRPANREPSITDFSQSGAIANGRIYDQPSVGGARPSIDRTTKPLGNQHVSVVRVGGESSSSNSQSSTSGGSLYPDVRSLTATRTRQVTPKTDQSSVTVTKPEIPSSASLGSVSSSSLTNTSSQLEKELSELERQKKQKLEELAKIQREREQLHREEKARIEKLKQEEKHLSDLEELRRKQQSDVADLLRMKKSLQTDIKREKESQEQETARKDEEEKERRDEIEKIQREEEKNRERQDEVLRLRLERKNKEDLERKAKQEKAVRENEEAQRAVTEAQERARREEELRQRELKETEERVARLQLEEQETLRELQQEDSKKKEEKLAVEERIRQEKDKLAKLEQDRLAALEEAKRNRAEQDRIEAEKREAARIERERQDRERQESEKSEREEQDRQRADEAKKIADEKLIKLNEENLKARAVPSPNLTSGWEKKLDPQTRRYFYINHNKGSTQWEEPAASVIQTGPKETYTTKLKEELTTPRNRGLQRSNSSPNIAKMVEDEQKTPIMPNIDRGNKPKIRREPIQKPNPLPVKRRDLNPAYGNVGRALTGLRNLGNTCYMNSTIQCLNNTSPLVTYLLTDDFLWDINRENILGSHGEVVDDFSYVVKALWSGQYKFITPRDFKTVVGKHQPMFSGFDQQDSQEFLTFLLDGLHEGLNKVKNRTKIPDQDNDNLPDSKAAMVAWQHHKLLNESIIVELFQGQLKSTLMCLTCKKQSKTFQAFMYLSLPIPSSSKCSLQDCLRQFTQEEKMTGSSRWRCPRCKADRDSVKKIDIWKLPRILLIALNRFVYEGQWRNKISAHVDFPVRDLNISSYVIGPTAPPYKLYGISNHFGTLDGGHYTACCKNPCTKKWYKYDDHEVYEVSESSIKTSAAYVLYYTSIELPPPDFRAQFN